MSDSRQLWFLIIITGWLPFPYYLLRMSYLGKKAVSLKTSQFFKNVKFYIRFAIDLRQKV